MDHADASTRVAYPTQVWSWSRARREVELAKCVVRCHTCHVTKSRIAGDLSLKGIRNGNAKLTVEQVREIRASPQSTRILADAFDMSHAQIWRIRTRKKWTWLE